MCCTYFKAAMCCCFQIQVNKIKGCAADYAMLLHQINNPQAAYYLYFYNFSVSSLQNKKFDYSLFKASIMMGSFSFTTAEYDWPEMQAGP